MRTKGKFMIFNLNDLFSVADIELTRHSSLRYNILLWSTLLQSNNSMKTITTQTHSYDKWLQEFWTAGALAFKHFVHLRIVTTWPRLMKSEDIWRSSESRSCEGGGYTDKADFSTDLMTFTSLVKHEK